MPPLQKYCRFDRAGPDLHRMRELHFNLITCKHRQRVENIGSMTKHYLLESWSFPLLVFAAENLYMLIHLGFLHAHSMQMSNNLILNFTFMLCSFSNDVSVTS